jgi:hypothetical protein
MIDTTTKVHTFKDKTSDFSPAAFPVAEKPTAYHGMRQAAINSHVFDAVEGMPPMLIENLLMGSEFGLVNDLQRRYSPDEVSLPKNPTEVESTRATLRRIQNWVRLYPEGANRHTKDGHPVFLLTGGWDIGNMFRPLPSVETFGLQFATVQFPRRFDFVGHKLFGFTLPTFSRWGKWEERFPYAMALGGEVEINPLYVNAPFEMLIPKLSGESIWHEVRLTPLQEPNSGDCWVRAHTSYKLTGDVPKRGFLIRRKKD